MIKILKYGEDFADEIFARVIPQVDVSAIVSDILADVKANGDNALFKYTEKFDGAKLDCLLVSREEIDEAVRKKVEFIPVKNVDEVIELALIRETVEKQESPVKEKQESILPKKSSQVGISCEGHI